MVTIKDVAKEAGVAISTVSNVLNGVDIVTEETKQKVLNAVETLKFVPNMNAKLMKTNKRNTIGLFLPSIQGDFYRMLMQEIHMQCKLKGYMLNIYISNENTSEEIYSMITSSGVVGAIVFNEQLHEEYIGRVATINIPMVFIDREYSGNRMSSVIIDNQEGASIAMEYLIKQGHRRIGYIHGIHNKEDDIRYQTYVSVMDKYQLPVEENIILRGFFEEAVAYSEVRKLVLTGTKIPDAFFCANDEMAWGCIRALTEVGVSVPDQVSVMGFDDIIMSAYYSPALTTMHSPIVELGNLSSKELFRLIELEEGTKGQEVRLSPTLRIRNTCDVRIGK